MNGTHSVRMGDRGRLVVPAEIRARAGLDAGVPLVLIESPAGLVVMTRAQAREQLRRQLEGSDLVTELLEERRAAARSEDAA